MVGALGVIWDVGDFSDTKSPEDPNRADHSGETIVGWVCLVPLPHPVSIHGSTFGVSARLLAPCAADSPDVGARLGEAHTRYQSQSVVWVVIAATLGCTDGAPVATQQTVKDRFQCGLPPLRAMCNMAQLQKRLPLRCFACFLADALPGFGHDFLKRDPQGVSPIHPEGQRGDSIASLGPVEGGPIKRGSGRKRIHARTDLETTLLEHVGHLSHHLVCLRACHSAVSQMPWAVCMCGSDVAVPQFLLVGRNGSLHRMPSQFHQ